MRTLAKYQMSYAAFDAAKHPRGKDGKFAAGSSNGAPSFRVLPMAEASPGPARRSLTRGEAWQRLGNRIAAIPASYTGSTEREAPVDGWKQLSITWQVPKSMPVAQHIAVLKRLKQVIDQHREPAIEKAQTTRQLVAVNGIKDRFTEKRRTGPLTLDPATPKGAVHRAYNHAAMLALHDFGIVDYGPFKMSDAQKEELTPLVPFMRFVRRRLGNAMHIGELKGAKAPYRAAFGQPFADQRKDAAGRVRLRVRSNQELVKRADFSARLAALQARRDPDGIEGGKAGRGHLLTEDEVRAAARQAATPTDAQAEAGNYRMGHARIGGLDVTIENAKGSVRRKVGRGGKSWQLTMPAHYGYVKRSLGADGDHVDVYLGPHAHEAEKHPVYVVDQVHADTGDFDEHKAMIGFRNVRHARQTYDAGFSDGKGPNRRGAITRMSFPDFKDWVLGPDTKRPLVKAGDAVMLLPFAEPLAKKATDAQKAKLALVMHEWKHRRLRSWRGKTASGKPRKGPIVRDQRQAIAIALNQAGMGKSAGGPHPNPLGAATVLKKSASRVRTPSGCLDPRVAMMDGHAHGILRKTGSRIVKGAADAHVVSVLPEVERLMPRMPMATPVNRIDRNTMVGDPRIPLAQAVLGNGG